MPKLVVNRDGEDATSTADVTEEELDFISHIIRCFHNFYRERNPDATNYWVMWNGNDAIRAVKTDPAIIPDGEVIAHVDADGKIIYHSSE